MVSNTSRYAFLRAASLVSARYIDVKLRMLQSGPSLHIERQVTAPPVNWEEIIRPALDSSIRRVVGALSYSLLIF